MEENASITIQMDAPLCMTYPMAPDHNRLAIAKLVSEGVEHVAG